tara:strand:- start:1625 stop:2008 length:384 start_codon:yes stop_codon:yes gene_type:complete
MKLRIRGNTLRLRLSRSEVDLVGQGKEVEESTSFPGGGKLQYVLRQSPAKTSVVKTNEGDKSCIKVIVDQNKAKEWAESEEVGLFGAEPLLLGTLELLIEKDFACLNPREGSEDSDSYPNPATVDTN